MLKIVLFWSTIAAGYLVAITFIVRGKGLLLRLATFFALFGAFPGFVIAIVHNVAATPTIYGPSGIHWWDFISLPIPYFFFGVPMIFGPYCFIVALMGGFIIRLAQESTHKWIEPIAIIILPLMAAIPVALIWEPFEAFGASIFWALVMLIFRKTIFGEMGREPSPRIQALYHWISEYR